MKKYIFLVFIGLFFLLQYGLWRGDNNMFDIWRLHKAIVNEKKIVAELTKRNDALEREVKFLKQRPESLEERARAELGMIKKGEAFYLVVEPER